LTIDKKGKIGDAKLRVLKEVPHLKQRIGDSKLSADAVGIAFAMAVDEQKAKNNMKTMVGDGASTGLTFSGQDNFGGLEIVRGGR